MSTAIERGRSDLLAWEASKPRNVFSDDENLGRALALRLGRERFEAQRPRFDAVGEMVASRLRDLAVDTNHDDNLPRLERYSGLGVRTESVVFHPSYHEAGRLIWDTGVLSDYEHAGNETVQLAIFAMLAQPGEVGHLCPLACTAGLIKVVQRLGTDDQKRRWLPGLLARDYDRRIHASQFLTEVQGGSDVGANAVVARETPEGWRIFGEKWFCSVIDAQLFLMTARPEGAVEGTRGLGLFVVPRIVGGETNEFQVRRLKRKLGTRAMASAEADFLGAKAEPVGPLDRGFKNVVELVLNTSRLYNAFSCVGGMQSAYWEALTYARQRRAFQKKISEFPLVQEALATLRSEAMAALASSLRLATHADTMSLGKRDDVLARAWRMGVNVNKYWTSVRNTQMARTAIEVLGGNGAIETFSPLVQLFRDSIVLESWEGSHNVLVQQVMRDAARYSVHKAFIEELRGSVGRLELPDADQPVIDRVKHGLGAIEEGFGRLEGGQGDQRLARRLVDHSAVALQLVAMLEELEATPTDGAKRSAITFHAQAHRFGDVDLPLPLPSELVENR